MNKINSTSIVWHELHSKYIKFCAAESELGILKSSLTFVEKLRIIELLQKYKFGIVLFFLIVNKGQTRYQFFP